MVHKTSVNNNKAVENKISILGHTAKSLETSAQAFLIGPYPYMTYTGYTVLAVMEVNGLREWKQQINCWRFGPWAY